MKILAPFDTVVEVSHIIKAGADELYCGLNTDYCRKKYFFSNARRMFYGNLGSFRELEGAIAIARKHTTPVFLCANGYLAQGAFVYSLKEISRAIEIGIDGVIIADISLIPFIKKEKVNCKIILSTLNPCFNSLGLEFYKDMGIDRVTLPINQMALEEIERICLDANRLNLELEVFANNVTCRNIPGYCLYHDFLDGPLYKNAYRTGIRLTLKALKLASKLMPVSLKGKFGRHLFASRVHPMPCRREYEFEEFEKSEKGFITKEKEKTYSLDRDFAQSYCGLCALYCFEKYGITAGKIAGRGYPTARKAKDVMFARRYLDKIKNGQASDDNFVCRGMEIYEDIYENNCRNKRCHYERINEIKQAVQGR